MANPRKRAKSPAQRLDGRKRRVTACLDHHDRRNLIAAVNHSKRIGFALNCTINVHPIYLDRYPTMSLAVWFKDELRNRITTWLRRRSVGWYGVWTRENYAGERREHIHLIIHCPAGLRDDLGVAIRRWYPGSPQLLTVGSVTWGTHPVTGYRVCVGLEYRLKQMTSKAQGPRRPGRPHRETNSRHDGAPVAPVLGLRCGVSNTLSPKARQAWQAEQDARWAASAIVRPSPVFIDRAA